VSVLHLNLKALKLLEMSLAACLPAADGVSACAKWKMQLNE
jgi:uncharacterized protein involved in tolerance to divalent cations